MDPTPAAPPAKPVSVQLPEAPPVDEFRDLLGQAVGLRLDSVSREFGGRNEMHVTALRNVTLDIGPGEFVAIVGPSGCGKSTLLALMGGLDRPTSGHVYGAGLALGELPDRDLSDYRLQRVSTIFQTFNCSPWSGSRSGRGRARGGCRAVSSRRSRWRERWPTALG